MSSATFGRLGFLLRWLGITLVVLLLLQLAVLLPLWNWAEEGYRQLFVDRLVTQSPMALVGVLLMLFGGRLDNPMSGRTPLRWVVAALSAVLAIALLVAVPMSISGDRAMADQTDQSLAAKKGQLEMARAQMENPEAIQQFVKQAEQAGQLPAQGTDEQKRQMVKELMGRQLDQAEQQLRQQERARDLAVNQRRIGGTGTAVVLAVSFVLVALAALL
ncbi:HpsJ family protein [Synechococcus sp. CS-1328]|uniref:HpsJ family protein n=1 Tax=Synechococcus sp. CS-1328 TaxID=2847976 RepID=UPI00223B6FFF|nr:HpsJ family protein [Synechococcus sp. CS-1328]MCT0224280.1 HpsJ family protein [Synechococcus sp. CS-1328]